MYSKGKDFINLIIFYSREITQYYLGRFLAGPLIKLFSICQKHHFRFIGKTRIIGDSQFIRSCEEFSRRLQRIDPPMYNELFIKNRFTFIQYSDAKYQNVMAGEYAVPLHYQKLKADGIGALMIYGFFCTTLHERNLISYVRHRLQSGFFKIPKEKTYTWLTEHKFPEIICHWYRTNLQSYDANFGKEIE